MEKKKKVMLTLYRNRTKKKKFHILTYKLEFYAGHLENLIILFECLAAILNTFYKRYLQRLLKKDTDTATGSNTKIRTRDIAIEACIACLKFQAKLYLLLFLKCV